MLLFRKGREFFLESLSIHWISHAVATIIASEEGIPKSEIEKLLAELAQTYLSGETTYDLTKYENTQITIEIEGPYWSGVVDKSAASFVLKAEEQFRRVYKEHGLDIPERGIVRMRVTEGCWLANIDIGNILKQLQGMNPQEIIMITTSAAIILGVWKAPEIIKSVLSLKAAKIKKELEESKLENSVELEKIRVHAEKVHAEERTKLVELLKPIENDARDLQQPIRALVSKMDEITDTITVDGEQEPMKKQEFKDKLEKVTRSKPEDCHIDQLYIIEGLETVKGEVWKVRLRYGSIQFKAELSLDTVELSNFVELYKDVDQSTDVSSELKVNARIINSEVRSAYVVGLGSPREDAVKLKDVLFN